MSNDPLQELTDFGLSQPSASNSVGHDTPQLDSLLSSMPEDVRKLTGPAINDFARAALLEDELRKEMDTPVPSKKDLLVTPGTLAKLLAGGAAAAFGGPAGLAAALGVGLGTVRKAEQQHTLLEEAKKEKIKARTDEWEKQQEVVEKQRNRLAGIFNTNPEAFVGADGQALAPDAIGWLITGADIPLYPMSKSNAARRGERWGKQWDFLNDALTKAANPEDAKGIIGVMFNQLGWDNPPPGLIDILSRTMGTPEFDINFASTLLKYGGPTGLNAMRFAAENNLALTDKETLRLVQFQPDDSTSPSQLLNANYMQLLDEYNNWAKTNPEQYAKIQKDATSPEDAIKSGAEAVFAGRPGDLAEFLNRANLPADVDPATFMSIYGLVDKEFGLVNTITGADQVNATSTMTPDERRNYKANTSLKFYKQFEDEAKNGAARRQAAFRNQKRAELRLKIPNAGDATIDALLNVVFEEVAKTNPKDPDTYMQKVDEMMPLVIKKYNEARGE